MEALRNTQSAATVLMLFASSAQTTHGTPTHLLPCPVSMFLMLLTRWKMLLLLPPPPELPSAGGAPPPIMLPPLAVRLCTASCRHKEAGVH